MHAVALLEKTFRHAATDGRRGSGDKYNPAVRHLRFARSYSMSSVAFSPIPEGAVQRLSRYDPTHDRTPVSAAPPQETRHRRKARCDTCRWQTPRGRPVHS